MPVSKPSPARTFQLPANLGGSPTETWSVKALTVGGARALDDLLVSTPIIEGRYASARTGGMFLAYLSFGGTTIRWEEEEGPILPPVVEFGRFTTVWDQLPDEIADWILECVYEVNPRFAVQRESLAPFLTVSDTDTPPEQPAS